MLTLPTIPGVLSPASRLVVLRNELALLEEDLRQLAAEQYSALEAVIAALQAKQTDEEIAPLRLKYEAATARYAAVYDTSESVITDINRLTERSEGPTRSVGREASR